MIYLVYISGGIYIIVIASFLYGWKRLNAFSSLQSNFRTLVSIVIPMRNEEDSIVKLLNELSQQNYPIDLYEIIVVDDHSRDKSFERASKFQNEHVKTLSLPDSLTGKKAALRHGIDATNGHLILTTDADCTVGKNWIKCFATYFEVFNPVMMLGPVMAHPLHKNNTFEQMQMLELFSLLGATAGSASIGMPIMCNGANLAFAKNVYPKIQHLYNNEKVHSGDDIFTLLTLKKIFPGRIHFIKSLEASVYTLLPDNLNAFFNQRKRWAAKTKYYRDVSIIATAAIVFGINLLLIINLVIGIIKLDLSDFLILWCLKSVVDFPLLYTVTSFYGEKRLMRWFPVVQSFYFLYVCLTVVGTFISPTKWKERLIKQ